MLLEKKQQKLQDNARFVNNYSRSSSYVQGNVNYNYAPTENFQVENEVRQTANQFANANTSYVQQPTYNYQQEQNGYRMQQNMPQNNYYQDNYQQVAIQNTYAQQNYVQPRGYFVPETKQDIYERVVPEKRAKSTNAMAKLMIAVYFFIISVCAALILVNVVSNNSSANAVNNDQIEYSYNQDALYYAQSEDGSLVEMKLSDNIVDYSYDTSTNWFDKFCDSVGKIFG